MKLLIKNGNLVLGSGVKKSDILIEDGKIKRIAGGIEETCNMIDAAGLHIFPGLIDMHAHLREPGFEYKEDIESGSKAAAAGGFTQIACMPNTSPVCDNAVVASYIKKRGEEVGLVKVHPIGAITIGEKGETLAELGRMKKAGIVAVSDDGQPVRSAEMMKIAMEYASDFGLLPLSHCESKSLSGSGVVNEGINGSKAGLKGITRASEEVMVSREIILSEVTCKPVHICHISTKGSVRMVRDAKKRGIKVSAETCPHYFALTDEEVLSLDPDTKVNPPLRTEEDRLAIIEGIKDGTIDVVATDHAPHHKDEKNVEYESAAFGISGLETAFSLSYTHLVKGGIIGLSKLAEAMSENPAALLGLEGGEIKEGAAADLMIADLNARYIIDPKSFKSKGKNTPFKGKEVSGRVKYTVVDGEVKYNDR